jgi:hypothetical protein
VDLGDLHTELLHGQHVGQMTERSDAGMPDSDALSRLFHPAQELIEIVRRQGRTRCEGDSGGIDEADGGKILLGVESAIRIKRHARRQRVLMQQDSVAVGLGTGGLGRGDHAAGAAKILDHDRLAQRFLHRFLDDPRGRIVDAAGRERHQHGDGAVRIGLRQSAPCQDTRGENRRRERAHKIHDTPPAFYRSRSAAAD